VESEGIKGACGAVRSRARQQLALALLASVGGAAPRGGPARPAAPPAYSEEMVVHEVELVVELPREAEAPALTSLLVREDGEPRTVVKVEPLAPPAGAKAPAPGGHPWDVVLYFDRRLADSDAVGRAAISLAKVAETLTDLGAVEVVVADPVPRGLLAATREPMLLKESLAGLAGQVRGERERSGARTVPELRRQADRLVAFLAAREGALPRGLFLVAGSRVIVSPRDLELISGAGGAAEGRTPPAATQLSQAVFEAAQVLAAYGWITCPVSGAGRDAGGGGFFRPQLAPLTALARMTAGQLAGDGRAVGWVVRGLRSRWRLWYQTPVRRDGRMRPIEVWLEGRTKLRAAQWVRSATPRALSEARLRNALAGDEDPSPIAVEARGEPVPGGTAVSLRITPPPGSAGAAAGPVRVSFGYAETEGEEVKFEHLEQTSGLGGPVWRWSGVVPFHDPCGKLAVEVEDLGLGVRAATAIRPAAARGPLVCAAAGPSRTGR
jgi:hypothetical protein